MLSPTEFLGKLVGQWELTGEMGDAALRQMVNARWTLGGLFVEMYFKSVLPASEGQIPYEAIYFIGYNADSDVYVMHLLDTFGVALVSIPGHGRRDGDSIPFVFQYDGGPFTNRFIYNEADDAWTFEQSYVRDGEVSTFASKRMTRLP